MTALMEADGSAIARPKAATNRLGRRSATGPARESVTLGGRRVPVSRPRVGAVDGSGELRWGSYGLSSGTEVLLASAVAAVFESIPARVDQVSDFFGDQHSYIRPPTEP
jgi:putative transposase